MANKLYDEASVQAIANAIRSKNKTETKYKISQMAQAIEDIPSIIKRKTGNPIEITDAAAAPLVKCVTEIQGSQDLHGYDKPWVGGAGKNLADVQNTSTAPSINTGDDVPYNSWTTDFITVDTSVSYTLSVQKNVVRYILFYANDKTYLGYMGAFPASGVLLNSYTRWSEAGYVRLRFDSETTAQLELGTTATAYEPYANICPITAYTEGEIEVRGKNWCDGVNAGLYINGDATYYGYSGTDNGLAIPTEGADYMTVSTTITQTRYRVCVGNINPSTQGNVQAYNGVNKDGTNDSVTISTQGYDYIIVNATDLTKIQVEKGSTATDYEPYTSTTHTTTYPSAIYRGSEDVVNGEVTSEMPVVSSPTWKGFLAGTYGVCNYFQLAHGATVVDPSALHNAICNMKKERVAYWGDARRVNESGMSDCFAINQAGTQVIVYDTDTSLSESDFATKYAGIQIAYPLATPTTSSVTPTNLPIKSLSGYNHIESSTGEMTIDYITDAYQNFVDTVESALPNTRKGGTKAMDIFLSLDTLEETTSSENIETKENNNSEDNSSEDISENIEETR